MATTSRSVISTSASRSGVRTVPGLTGRSAVASYSSSVITLRASTRNCSGSVARSRSPARLSATSGWRLTISGTGDPLAAPLLVALDQDPDRVDRHAHHAVHVRGVEVVDLAGADLVDAQADRARPHPADARHHVQGRRLHVVADHAGLRPHVELEPEVRARHLLRH